MLLPFTLATIGGGGKERGLNTILFSSLKKHEEEKKEGRPGGFLRVGQPTEREKRENKKPLRTARASSSSRTIKEENGKKLSRGRETAVSSVCDPSAGGKRGKEGGGE